MDYVWGALGGAMIGCAAALFLLGNGRIMGVSGILGGLLSGGPRDIWRERMIFVVGLLALPAFLQLSGLVVVDTNLSGNLALVAVAGVLVGLGTRIGNGCTSGHGVCGISRLSVRGIVATCVYIAAGAATVAALRGLWGGL